MAIDYVKISEFPITPTIVDGDYVPIQNGGQNYRFNLANLLNGSTYTKEEINELLENKQPTLVSGGNIKTVGGISLLGAGDVPLGGASSIPVIQVLEDDIYVDTSDQFIAVRLTPEQSEYFYNSHFVAAEVGSGKLVFKCEKFEDGSLAVSNALTFSPDGYGDAVYYTGSIYDYGANDIELELYYEYMGSGSSDTMPYVVMQQAADDWWNDYFAHITIDENTYDMLTDNDYLSIHTDIYFENPYRNTEFIFNRPVPYDGGSVDTMMCTIGEGQYVSMTPYAEYDSDLDEDIYYVEMYFTDLYEDLEDIPSIYVSNSSIEVDPENMHCSIKLYGDDRDILYYKPFAHLKTSYYGYTVIKSEEDSDGNHIFSGTIMLDELYDYTGYIEWNDEEDLYCLELDLQYKLSYPQEDGTYELVVENGKPTWVLKE